MSIPITDSNNIRIWILKLLFVANKPSLPRVFVTEFNTYKINASNKVSTYNLLDIRPNINYSLHKLENDI